MIAHHEICMIANLRKHEFFEARVMDLDKSQAIELLKHLLSPFHLVLDDNGMPESVDLGSVIIDLKKTLFVAKWVKMCNDMERLLSLHNAA